MYRMQKVEVKSYMKMVDLIEGNPSLLLFMQHFNIDLRISELTVSQLCKQYEISETLFISVANLYNGFKNKQRINPNKRDTLKLLKINYLDTIIYVGKNNKQNDLITHKLSSRNDYWFHVENAPGSHVLVKSNNPSDEIISFAAMLAAKFSTLKDNGKVSVNYTQVRNLKKIPGKPGHMVILNTYKSLTISIDDALIDNVFIANKLK